MKFELARFNEETDDGRVIMSDGTAWKDPMPVYDWDGQRIVGTVSHVALDGNKLMGVLSFEIDRDFWCLTISMRPVVVDVGPPVCLSGKIISAHVSPEDKYPWKD